MKCFKRQPEPNGSNDKLDVLIGDTAILDYYRANDPGCNLRLLGDSIFDDAYAVGMQKGFPFRVFIFYVYITFYYYYICQYLAAAESSFEGILATYFFEKSDRILLKI